MKKTRKIFSDPIPIIDVFAGPGGLGEGFSSLQGDISGRQFKIALSVEKDPVACRTLMLRSIRRHLCDANALESYFDFLRGRISIETFMTVPINREAASEANSEVLNAEMGKFPDSELDRRIRNALGNATDWVLIGGPPCQAYSIAGRSRRANDASFANDEKHFLYQEYLRIIRVHAPPIFVMENVKGLISSSHAGVPMFEKIRDDLSDPGNGASYEIRSLVKHDDGFGLAPEDFVIRAERYGIPQARHRVIMLGVRSDFVGRESSLLVEAGFPVSVKEVIGGLPAIRSRLSRGGDSADAWHGVLRSASTLVRGWGGAGGMKLIDAMDKAARDALMLEEVGSPFIENRDRMLGCPMELATWLCVPSLGGVIQHESRGHMSSDLARYMFATTFAHEFGYSPKLDVFPSGLLPKHKNANRDSKKEMPFSDRFRVQRGDAPSSTIVSHIAKDGHYYIHYDPSQCRSLTVREAARLQTFPDDYFFMGNRTQQYAQVGNAVPPLLASKIAMSVFKLINPHVIKSDSFESSGIAA